MGLQPSCQASFETRDALIAEPTRTDLERIRTRKPEAPCLTVELGNGKQHKIWCTFGPQQIDLDVYSVTGVLYFA